MIFSQLGLCFGRSGRQDVECNLTGSLFFVDSSGAARWLKKNFRWSVQCEHATDGGWARQLSKGIALLSRTLLIHYSEKTWSDPTICPQHHPYFSLPIQSMDSATGPSCGGYHFRLAMLSMSLSTTFALGSSL